jgi:hypothetical protein
LIGLAVVFAGVALWAADAQYVGVAKCKACHKAEFEIWQASPHAGAFDKLSAEEQAKDECVACHTTGHGGSAAEGADLKGVGCESCHGPGSLYRKVSIMSKSKYKENPDGQRKLAIDAGLVLPDESSCTSCHNEKSPTFKGFNFEEAKAKIKHWDME